MTRFRPANCHGAAGHPPENERYSHDFHANAGVTIQPPSPQPSTARGEGDRESAVCAPKALLGREGSGRIHAGRPWLRGTLSAGLLTGLLSLPLANPPARAFTLEEFQFSDPAKAEEFKRLTEELRCLVCQNESLAGSQADLAQDLREEVYRLLQSGKSRQEVIDFLVERYGDFVLYDPPLKPATYPLWFGPLLLAGVGGLFLFLTLRKKREAREQ
ncbi:MAG: cytochrome c-type biogenesis protein CcmH, partial [Gammaproteobacteria bacterium]|nr:cytochrome c-type biogenesis protein CcmH [Gammaproteobacteria bacterium]